MDDLHWAVLEDDPKPNDYVSVIGIKHDEDNNWLPNVNHSLYSNQGKAIYRAELLRMRYSAKKVRLFYPDRHADIIHITKHLHRYDQD